MKQFSIRIILLITITSMTILVAALAIREVYVEGQMVVKIQALKQATIISDKLFETVAKYTMARDITTSMIYAKDDETIGHLRPIMQKTRNESDAIRKDYIKELRQYNFPELNKKIAENEAAFAKLNELRNKLNEAIATRNNKQKNIAAELWFQHSIYFIVQTQDMWMEFIKHFSDIDPEVTLQMRFKHFLGVIMEYTGRERAVIARLLVENSAITPAQQADLLKWHGAVEMGWERLDSLATQSGLDATVFPYIKDAESHYSSLHDMVKDIFYVPGKHIDSYPIGIELWLELTEQTTDSLYALKDASVKDSESYRDALETRYNRRIVVNITIMIISFCLCFYSLWIIVFRVITPINNMVDALINATMGNPVSLAPIDSNRNDEIGKLGRVLHAFQQNTEEIKRTSANLEIYTKALELSNKELDDFAYIASHDLKEPLRGIHNHSRFLLEDNQDKLDPDSVSRLGRLIYLSKRMELLVNDLLYFSRLGRQELAIQETDLNYVIKDIEDTLDVFLSDHKAKIILPQPLPTITCDKTRITELFRNLITNAVKYNDSEQKIIEIGVKNLPKFNNGKKDQRIFYVKDNGRGVAPEFYEDIFRIFKRLQSNKDGEEGTGVGLTFVKKIIERHGGKIWLESKPALGTTFYFTLEGKNYENKSST